MEKEIRQVVRSKTLDKDILELYEYGIETFGITFADIFLEHLKVTLNALSYQYLLYPECRHLETKTQIYRNVILGKYLIIYRINKNRIEILRALHGSQSPKTIKSVKKIKIK
ncbi:MAG: type II toxin-antitoxin system RelE/ParE family toxin [Bacteroidota bacterium]